jgi:hypothetical protein
MIRPHLHYARNVDKLVNKTTVAFAIEILPLFDSVDDEFGEDDVEFPDECIYYIRLMANSVDQETKQEDNFPTAIVLQMQSYDENWERSLRLLLSLFENSMPSIKSLGISGCLSELQSTVREYVDGRYPGEWEDDMRDLLDPDKFLELFIKRPELGVNPQKLSVSVCLDATKEVVDRFSKAVPTLTSLDLAIEAMEGGDEAMNAIIKCFPNLLYVQASCCNKDPYDHYESASYLFPGRTSFRPCYFESRLTIVQA